MESGEYKPEPSIETVANAMDVGNPSNFVRLKRFFGDDWNAIKEKVTGFYFDDEQIKSAMREVFNEKNYVMCPHTAVAYLGLEAYRKNQTNDFTGVFLSTAHPAKFIELVEETLEKPIEIPERLELLLSIEKVATKMDSSFIAFKKLLMSTLK